METLNRRYIWLFFAILIAVMVGAYILNINTTVLKKPIPLKPGTTEQVSSYYIIKDTSGTTILQTGLPSLPERFLSR